MDDQEIIALYFARNERAIEESNLKYGRYCYVIADNILKNHEDSEECVSDTWLRSWQSIPPKRPSVLKMFFAEITRNLAFDRYRAEHAKKRFDGELPLVLDELAECVASRTDVEAEVLGNVLSDSVNKFLRKQRARDASIFLRRYFFTEPVRDIAAHFGITENHASVILKRMREKLRRYLTEEGLMHE